MRYDKLVFRWFVSAALVFACTDAFCSPAVEVVATWLSRLRSPDASVRAEAAYHPPVEIPAGEAPLLLAALKDRSAFVRACVAAALGDIQMKPDLSTPALIRALSDNDQSVCQQAAVSLGKLGPFAVPDLINSLDRATDQLTKQLVNDYLRGHQRNEGRGIDVSLKVETPKSPEIYIAFALQRCGVNAVEPLLLAVRAKRLLRPTNNHIPVYSSYNDEAKSRFEAIAAELLTKVGPPALPSLSRWSEDKVLSPFVMRVSEFIFPASAFLLVPSDDRELMKFARRAPAKCKGDQQAYVRFAIDNCGDPRRKIKAQCFNAIAALHSSVPVDLLFAGLKNPEFDVSSAARGTLRDTIRATNHIPSKILTAALHDPHQEVRSAAAAFLIAGKQDAAIPDLKGMLDKQFAEDALNIVEALPQADESTIDTLATILLSRVSEEMVGAFLETPDNEAKGVIQRILLNLYSRSDVVRQTLVDKLSDSSDMPRQFAAEILSAAGKNGVESLSAVVKDQERSLESRLAAIYVLRHAAMRERDVQDTLRAVLNDPSPEVRSAAAIGLARTDTARKAVPALVEALQSNIKALHPGERDHVFDELFEALVEASPTDANDILTYGELYDQLEYAIDIVGSLGNGNHVFLASLLKALSHENPRVRAAAARALGHFPSAIDQVRSELTRKLEDPVPSVQLNCARALAKLGINTDELGALFKNVIIAAYVDEKLKEFFDSLVAVIKAAGEENEEGLKPFPWPPPKWSHIGEFGRDFPRELLGSDETTLGEIYLKFYHALKAADKNFESGLFGAPGGFALLAKIERVKEDGTPLPGDWRWVQGTVPPLTLVDYIGELFMERPGYFREIAFVITDRINFGQSDQKLPDISAGGTDLPADIAALALKGRNAYVLVYSFERTGGTSATQICTLSAEVHFRKSGIWDTLISSKQDISGKSH